MKLQATTIFAICALASASAGQAATDCYSETSPHFKAMKAYADCADGHAKEYARSGDSARDVAIAAVESCWREMAAQWVESNKCRPGSFDETQEKGIKESTERSLIRLIVIQRAKAH